MKRSLTKDEIIKAISIIRAISLVDKNDAIPQDYALETLHIMLLFLLGEIDDECVQQLEADYEEFVQRDSQYMDDFEGTMKEEACEIIKNILVAFH